MLFQSQPLQARQRQIGGVERAAFDLGQPRLDPAAQQLHFQVRAQMQGLGLAAQAGGAHRCALRQFHQRLGAARR